MRATAVIMQNFNRTDQDYAEFVPSSVYAMAIYIFLSGICFSLFNIVNILSFSHIEAGTSAVVSTCAALLLAFLLTRLTLTGLARLNGLRSLVGLTLRLAINSA